MFIIFIKLLPLRSILFFCNVLEKIQIDTEMYIDYLQALSEKFTVSEKADERTEIEINNEMEID